MKRPEKIIKVIKKVAIISLLTYSSLFVFLNLLSLFNTITKYKYEFLNSLLSRIYFVKIDLKNLEPLYWITFINSLLIIGSMIILIKVFKNVKNNFIMRILLILVLILFIVSIANSIFTVVVVSSINDGMNMKF